ncbi:cuscuta receptor 1-like isoform X4 [Populus alba]|uniref:cuscuta receptor 1-like isoform X4 n=1 Tax=Populus alba TaxID=43335 RepID=UPI00158A0BC9|nr:receptor like protein 21-like isoform X4 [Populus alba]
MGLFLEMFTVLVMAVFLQGWLPLGCLEEERAALFQLKDAFNYPNGTSLPSWRKGDIHCCSWENVECNSSTGRVIALNLWSLSNHKQGDWYFNTSLFLPFQELNDLSLWDNRIAGLVEKKGSYELQQLSKLKYLDLRYNRFNNSILSSIVGFSSLKSLYLSYNRLEGLIDFKESLSTLKVLDLSGNNINKLVASRGSSNLYLRLNHITTYGSSFQLLQSLGAFPYLTKLDLSDNNFRGRILGDELQNLSSLQRLYLDGCSLDEHSLHKLGALSSLKLLSLSRVSGIIPYQDFLDLKNLKYLDLSSNTFNNSIFQTINKGEIPPKIGNLSMIKVLNLSHNSLTGPIPPTFSRLKEIESLDLSYNKLDGEIPPQLTKLFFLEFFNVAHNNLSGKTPARVAQFATFEESCYKDNPFLCGQPLSKVCGAAMSPSPTPTLTTNEDNSGFMDMDVFYVTFGVAYIMVLLVIGAVLYINPYWRRAWFYFIEVSSNNCYYFLVDNIPILSKFGFS